MAKMKSLRRRPSSSIQKKWRHRLILMFLILIEDKIKIPMCIKNPSSNKMMCRLTTQFLDSSNEVMVDRKTPKFFQEFIIINFLVFVIFDFIRIDYRTIIILILFNFRGLFSVFHFILGAWFHILSEY